MLETLKKKKNLAEEKLQHCPTLNTAELLDTGDFRLISAMHFCTSLQYVLPHPELITTSQEVCDVLFPRGQ